MESQYRRLPSADGSRVGEWCRDYYSAYADREQTDPAGAELEKDIRLLVVTVRNKENWKKNKEMGCRLED